jgi:hypothetical protein
MRVRNEAIRKCMIRLSDLIQWDHNFKNFIEGSRVILRCNNRILECNKTKLILIIEKHFNQICSQIHFIISISIQECTIQWWCNSTQLVEWCTILKWLKEEASVVQLLDIHRCSIRVTNTLLSSICNSIHNLCKTKFSMIKKCKNSIL